MSVARPARVVRRRRALNRDTGETPRDGWIAQAEIAESGWGQVGEPVKIARDTRGLGEQ